MFKEYKFFDYFINCYYYQCITYEDLEDQLDEYLNSENKIYIDGLRLEIDELYNIHDPQMIVNFIFKHERRVLSTQQAEKMIEMFYEKFKNMK